LDLKQIDSRPVDDIDDPKHYSIEVQKQKAEHDRMIKRAEEKKINVKSTINKLLGEFRRLKSRNNELPSYLQLPVQDFIIDNNMRIDLEKETEDKIGSLHKETLWESEKHRIALAKINLRFKDCIECDRIVLYSFLNDHKVSSYRSSKLSEDFYRMVNENKRRMTIKENNNANKVRRISPAVLKLKGVGAIRLGSGKEEFLAPKPNVAKPQKLVGKIAKVIEKAEQRKQKRLNRQEEWSALYSSKPDGNYEDPGDMAVIKIAELTIGDFKLKSADNFLVPEEQRVDAEKKKAQLFKLRELVHDLKKGFNDQLLSLRDEKILLIDQIAELIEELKEIQGKLPDVTTHFNLPELPTIKPDEVPEKKYECTLEMLIEFRKNILGLDTTILESLNTNNKTENNHNKPTSTRVATEQHVRSTSIQSSYSSLARSTSSRQCDSANIMQHENEAMEQQEKCELEISIEKEQTVRLSYRKDILFKSIFDKLSWFDKQLQTLRQKKIKLDVDLKNADLRMVTLFEEFLLLKDFEKRENELAAKLMSKELEKDAMIFKVEECKEAFDIKKNEVEKLNEREKALFLTFTNTMGDNNKFEAFLTKVFKKKIKRAKKKNVEEENSSDDGGSDDDDDSDDDFDSDDEGESDDELDDSVCPTGCDPVIFDQICLLRERKLDLEEALVEVKKACDVLKKEQDTLSKKVKIIDNGLTNAGSDLEAFQREKQQKLNELDVVVTLKFNQIQYTMNNTIPQNLSSCLVFDRHFLDNLQNRIKQLECEKVKQKQLYRERRQQHVQMLRDKKTMETKIKELDSKVEQIQMLKFGRLVDLEKLETVSVNRVAEELKAKLEEQAKSNSKEISEWDKMIDGHQSELTKLIRENTRRLDSYTILLQKNKDLQNKLNSRQKNLGSEFQGYRQADLEERQRLVQLVQLQAQEVDALKDEVSALSRKGGHVLPPARSSLAAAHSESQ